MHLSTCTYLYHTCVDVDECQVNEGGCSSKARCINTPGSYYCKCKRGYVGDGFKCTKKRRKDDESKSWSDEDSSEESSVEDDRYVIGRCERGFVRYGRRCKGATIKWTFCAMNV